MDESPINKMYSSALRTFKKYSQIYQHYLDRAVPFTLYRWSVVVGLIFIFALRIITVHGYYIICYTLAIYLLSLFLAFISPKFDPAYELDEAARNQEEGTLPTSSEDEFRPFIRRLPEFQFWHSALRATLIAFFASLFPVLNIPVFWPILVLYYIVLTFITMRRQISHMIQYHYVPFDFGKKRFDSK